jgi:hypothetical protein
MYESIGQKPNGDAQEMFSLIQEQQFGELLSVKAFCKMKSVSEARFYYWRKKYLFQTNPTIVPEVGKFSLLELTDDEQSNAALFAEYKGLKLYRKVPVSYLKELMS